MTTNTTFFPQKIPKYICECCNTKTNNKKDFSNHLLTAKHSKNSGMTTNTTKNFPYFPTTYECICGKNYKDRAGLWRHKKKCNQNLENENENKIVEKKQETQIIEKNEDKINTLTNLVLEVVKQNQELTKQIVELSKNNHVTNNNNNNCITNNKFNLNFFLNEKCKDALNIMEFVNSLQLQLKDLEQTGQLGFVEGISKIFVKGLKELDIHKRPIHCSDLKREILYIKDEDKWEKENMEKNKITNAIRVVVNKNIKQIPEWTKKNPNYRDSSSKKNDEYLHLITNSMSGIDEEEVNSNMNKIIHNISKEVVIDK
jgi:hypothetical protein